MKSERPSRSGFSYRRILLGLVLCSAGVLLALIGFGLSSGASALAQNSEQNQVGTKLAPEVLAETANGNKASVVILLAEQADVSAAYEMKDQDARGWFVYNTLTQHASRTQLLLQTFLTAKGISYQSFWAANMIVATVDRSLVESLALRADVARIDTNKPTRWIEDPDVANFGVTQGNPEAPTAVEWGVTNVNAPAVWAMGFTGQGMVVGDLDTGMRWTHNALKLKYRGWNGVVADHNFNWHDSIHSGGGATCGANTVEPCDDQGHGTHTAGTTVGDDGTNQVGVAPGAKWIGCRNMDQGAGTPATYTECFQFMIAPTDLSGNNANPSLRPHVLNNSWGCPASEGCVTRAELETIVINTEASGIFVEVSAGNSGSGCSTVADAPAIYSASFSTGAIDINNALAGFSSRGPSTFYTPNLLKPNISGPGVNVRSSTRTSDSTYGNMSGTSMAGPHVVGVVALLWSARPQLVRNMAATKTLLQNTANPMVTVALQTCGGVASTQIPNNSFGYGRVDALAAVNAAPGGTPTPTPIATATATPTPGTTVTPTATPGSTATATPTATPVSSATPTTTPGSSATPTATPASSATPTATPGSSATPTVTPGSSATPSPTPTSSATPTATPGSSATPTPTTTPGSSATPTPGSSATPTPTTTPSATPLSLANISTRLLVGTGDNAMIGGFIVTGAQAKTVLLRGIGPSLGVPGQLANPTLELRDSNGVFLEGNDDWQQSPNRQAIIDTTIPPANDLESAILRTVPPGQYTAILRGVNNGTGIGLVEAYDLSASVSSKLANIATRGSVQTGNNVLIAGTIVVGQGSQKVIIRAIGPSLNVPGKMANPTLELRDENGAVLEANDDWINSPNKQAIIDTTIPPSHDMESAIIRTLPANGAHYTAIVSGANNTTGIAVVEIYALN